jgi:hypothetical protein
MNLKHYIRIIEQAETSSNSLMPNLEIVTKLGDNFLAVMYDGQAGVQDQLSGQVILQTGPKSYQIISIQNGRLLTDYVGPESIGPAAQKALDSIPKQRPRPPSPMQTQETYVSNDQVRSIVKRMMEDSRVPQKPRQGPLLPQTGAGKHKDRKKDQKQGNVKHKNKELDEGKFGRYRDEDDDNFRDNDRNVGVENESNNYAVYINGKIWKVFSDPRKAMNIAKSLRIKGKDVEVLPTGAPPSMAENLKNPKDNPCWKGYKPVGTKKKGGRTVPNCVPKESMAEEKQKGVDGKACWKGYKRMGTKKKSGRTVDNCVKMESSIDTLNTVNKLKEYKFTSLPYTGQKKEKKAPYALGSKHIGKGKETNRAGLSGMKANTKSSNKPVVSVESVPSKHNYIQMKSISESILRSFGLIEKSPPGFKGTVKAMKKHPELIKGKTKDGKEKNPYALAWHMKNKGYKSHKKADGSNKD